MSDATLAALDDAIRAHVANEHDGAPVAHWVITYGALDETDDIAVGVEAPPGQPGYVGVGLMHAALHPNAYEEDPDD